MQGPTRTVAIALTLALGITACGPGETDADLPNVVIVVADDLGRRDVSFHGGELPTPNIDRIAREGVALERFYSAPVCSPTRAGLLTGRYPIRYGLMRSVIPPWRDYGLDTDEVLLPELLAEAGYAERGIFGKWHLGHTSVRYHPLRRGFTEFVGHYNGGIDYFVHEREGERDWQHGYTSVDEHGYSTDLLTDYAVEFIARHADGEAPFLLYVPYNAVHSPWQAREDILPRYADLPGIDLPPGHQESNEDILGYVGDAEGRREKRRITAAMGESLDTGVGRILDALDAHAASPTTRSSCSSATTAASSASATTRRSGAPRLRSTRAASGSPRRRGGRRAGSRGEARCRRRSPTSTCCRRCSASWAWKRPPSAHWTVAMSSACSTGARKTLPGTSIRTSWWAAAPSSRSPSSSPSGSSWSWARS